MNKRSFFVLFFAAIFALTSCDDDSVSDVVSSDKLTATVDGESWSSLTRVTVKTDNTFTITGTNLSGETLVLTVYGSAEGDYTLSVLPLSAQCGAVYKESVSATTEDSYVSTSGTVTISELDETEKTVSGTFDFTLVSATLSDTISISDGTFTELSYTTTTSSDK